jgi:predicted nucleic acid-binding protein
MTKYLLDSDAMIALNSDTDNRRSGVDRWTADKQVSSCPITEGALARHIMRQAKGKSSAVKERLKAFHEGENHHFVSDSLPYTDADLSRIIGHNQVTDAYLVSLAKNLKMKLATLDQALATLYPETAVLIPWQDFQMETDG